MRNCLLPGFSPCDWTSEEADAEVRMGAPPEWEREGEMKDHPIRRGWAKPCEDIVNEGCPGSWYRTEWCTSLERYRRRLDDNGNRISNPSLDRCEDPLVHEAVMLLEHYEDAWRIQRHNAYQELQEEIRENNK